MRVERLVGRPAHIVAALVAVLVWAIPTAAVAAPPPNDAFAARTTIATLPYADTQSTLEATEEPGEPSPNCGPMGKTIWYQFTPVADSILGANTLGSDFDTLTAVWTGGQVGSLTAVACSDGFSTVFAADAGTTYLVQVGGWDGDAGQLSFRLREVDAGFISGTVTETGTGVPLGDTCVDVRDLDFGTFSFTLTDETGGYEVPVRPGAYVVGFFDECDDSNDHKSEWYDDVETLGAATEVSVTSSADASNINAMLDPACPGWGFRNATHVIGTDGPDVLVGGPGDDVLCGLGGNDRIRGEGGRDVLIGDVGRDKLVGGDGADFFSGDTGHDELFGGNGADFIQGGNGQDRLRGGAEHDRMFGDAGNDQMSGGGDNDYIEGEKGSDDLSGGSGDDKLLGKSGDDTMNGGAGKDLCDGDEGHDEAAPTCERTKDVP
jgi:Ca2+-binding RTX toxin-like protein